MANVSRPSSRKEFMNTDRAPRRMVAGITTATLLVVGLAGCASAANTTPTSVPTTAATLAPTQPATLLPTIAPTPPPTDAPTEAPTQAPPTPVEYTEITKNGEGGHGGPPLVDLPASFVVDYTVSGTCTFKLSFEPENMSPAVQVRSVKASGTTGSGGGGIPLEARK